MVDSSRINLQPFTPRIVALMRFELAVKLFCSGNPLEPELLSFMWLNLRRIILLLKKNRFTNRHFLFFIVLHNQSVKS